MSYIFKDHSKAHKLEELLGIVSLGKGVIDVTKFEKLHNSQVLATLVIDTPTSNKRVTKTMRNSFLPKDWEQNENAMKEFVAPILAWHRSKFTSNMQVFFFRVVVFIFNVHFLTLYLVFSYMFTLHFVLVICV